MPRPVVLSIAGSDSGGGAGIQADIRSIFAMGGFATTALTALTAQNLQKVHSVQGVDASFLQSQVETIWEGFDVKAVKTGMLWSDENVNWAASWAEKNPEIPFVIDPVMLATSGAKLIGDAAIDIYRKRLLPASYLATPNLDEASFLLNREKPLVKDMEEVAKIFGETFSCNTLLKGGHLEGDPVDVLYWEGEVFSWTHARVEGVQTHGSGCTLSALIATELAKEIPLGKACENAIGFLGKALRNPIQLDSRTNVLGHEEVS